MFLTKSILFNFLTQIFHSFVTKPMFNIQCNYTFIARKFLKLQKKTHKTYSLYSFEPFFFLSAYHDYLLNFFVIYTYFAFPLSEQMYTLISEKDTSCSNKNGDSGVAHLRSVIFNWNRSTLVI